MIVEWLPCSSVCVEASQSFTETKGKRDKDVFMVNEAICYNHTT